MSGSSMCIPGSAPFRSYSEPRQSLDPTEPSTKAPCRSNRRSFTLHLHSADPFIQSDLQ